MTPRATSASSLPGFWTGSGKRAVREACIKAAGYCFGFVVLGGLFNGWALWLGRVSHVNGGSIYSILTWLSACVLVAVFGFALSLFNSWAAYTDAPSQLSRPSLRLLQESLSFRVALLPDESDAPPGVPSLIGHYEGFPVVVDFTKVEPRRRAPPSKLRLRILIAVRHPRTADQDRLYPDLPKVADAPWSVGFTRIWNGDDFEPLTMIEWEEILGRAISELCALGYKPAQLRE